MSEKEKILINVGIHIKGLHFSEILYSLKLTYQINSLYYGLLVAHFVSQNTKNEAFFETVWFALFHPIFSNRKMIEILNRHGSRFLTHYLNKDFIVLTVRYTIMLDFFYTIMLDFYRNRLSYRCL